jgi:tight adherence protein B
VVRRSLPMRLAVGLLAVLLGLVLVGVAGAEGAPVPLGMSEPDLRHHPLVRAVVTPPAAMGGEDLTPETLIVLEDGRRRPVSVEKVAGDRLEVVLLVDTSGSMWGAPLAAAQRAATAFVDRLPDDANVALVGFGSSPRVASPLTDDHASVAAAVDALVADGRTALHDAVILATRQLSGAPGTRPAMVLLSDGEENTSTAALGPALGAVQAAGARLDVIELVTEERDPAVLRRLAAAGSGRVAAVDDPSGLGAIYREIADSLAAEHRITWQASASGPTPVTVRVEQGGVVAEHQLVLDYPEEPEAAEVVAAPPAPPSPGGPGGGWMLLLGGACVGGALLLVGLVTLLPGRSRRRLDRLGPALGSTTGGLGDLAGRASAVAEGALERGGRRRGLDARLERAGLSLRPGELVVGVGGLAVAGLVLGLLVAGPIGGLVLAGGAVVGAHVALDVKRDRRRRAFADQLSDTLQLLASSLRAGHGLLQAIDSLAHEAPEPTRSELRRLVVETRLGRDLSESLAAMADRLASDDFAWIVQAIDINREVGGDLAGVLDTVGETVRERRQVQRQVRSLTAEGRMSAYVLLALPLLMALFQAVSNPSLFRLLTFGPGLVMSGAAVTMLVIGSLWFKALCKLEY